MLEISILKIQDPGCFWGRVERGDGLKVQSPEEYEDLHVRMNLFYHDVNLDVQKIRPPSLAERQVCVVYSPTLKSWCRAVVESVFLGTVGCQVMCFLVDHAEHILVSSDRVRSPLECFLELPFWVRKFRLAGVSPMKLHVPVYQEKARLVPSAQWDSSATRYLHSLVQASSLLEAVLCEVERDLTTIELYLTIRSVKVCVNDDLVTKKFAYFSSNKSGSSPGGCLDDPSPVMLTCDITNPDDILAQNGRVSRALGSSISPRKELQSARPDGSETGDVYSGGAPGVQPSEAPEPRPLPLPLPPQTESAPQPPQTESAPQPPQTVSGPLPPQMDAGVMAQPCALGGSGGRHGDVAKTANGSSEESLAGARSSDGGLVDGSCHALEAETQASLAEELLSKINLFRFMKFLNPISASKMANPQVSSEEKAEMDREQNVPEAGAEVPESIPAPPAEAASTAPPPGHVRAERVLVEEEEEKEEEEEDEATASTEKQRLQDELNCARLLQLLNPDPLNPEAECLDSNVGAESPCEGIPRDPGGSGIVLHSAMGIDPCTSLARSPLTDGIRKSLLRMGVTVPRAAQWFCWPAVARGCDTLLISGCGGDPLSYLPPLLSHLLLVSACGPLSSRAGPLAVILCHGWEKAQSVFDLLEDIPAAQSLHPAIVLVGEKDEAKAVKLQRNCQVLVSTPSSLVRLLGLHCFLFLRLCHLVLDEVDLLFSRSPEAMVAALQHFQKAGASEDSAPSRQVVAVGQRWSRELEALVRDHMTDPSIIITIVEEAALYGGVHQMVLMCLDCTKVSVLLGALDFVPEGSQKTLIITNTVEEVEHVFQAVNNTAAFCLKVHEGLTYQFDFVVDQWRKPIGPGTHVILVLTNACLTALGIRDATRVVHYGFPTSPRLFGTRLCCMAQNFRNFSRKDGEAPPRAAQSLLLLSERDARHVLGVLRYLERSGAALPPELLLFARGVQQARERRKSLRPLCQDLKSYGVCRDCRTCPDRHCIMPDLDAPQHPESGNVVVVPLYIKNACCYYGRIVSGTEGAYESLAAEMAEYYATEKFNATEVVEGGIYGILEDGVYHRVQVLLAPDTGERLFRSVSVRFLDEGREQEVKAHQLLRLPGRLHRLPPQALEMVVCRTKPIDGELDWNPKVTRSISQKIKGAEHRAKIVLSLGNTVWLDPMVRVTRLPGLKTSINEYNVRSEILASGLGCSKPDHLELLRALCQEASAPGGPGASALPDGPAEPLEIPAVALGNGVEARLEIPVEPLGNGVDARLEIPVEPLGNGVDARLEIPVEPLCNGVDARLEIPVEPLCNGVDARLEIPVEPLGNGVETGTDGPQSGREEWDDSPEGESGAPGPPTENGPLTLPVGARVGLCLWASLQNGPCGASGAPERKRGAPAASLESGVQENGLDVGPGCGAGAPPAGGPGQQRLTQFHPHIKWFEREDCVTLTIKLLNPCEQTCQILSDRVLYSARVDARRYHAELRLRGTVMADASSWELKAGEPVLRLMKEEKGPWNALLQHKSPFVTFDFDHFEEDGPEVQNIAKMEPSPAGERACWFVESTGEDGCYVHSNSDSDSDSD